MESVYSNEIKELIVFEDKKIKIEIIRQNKEKNLLCIKNLEP